MQKPQYVALVVQKAQKHLPGKSNYTDLRYLRPLYHLHKVRHMDEYC
jgi:hypothetical protein